MSAIENRLSPVTIENARIIFRNFGGAEGQYNRAGDRNFGVVLPPDVAQVMAEDGWNVKFLKSREEGEDPTPWVPVAVSYKGRPPRIVLITHRVDPDTGDFIPQRVNLPEELVEMADFVDIANCDLILNPYQYNVNGNAGVKAYLKTMFITIQQDELERKYAAVEEIQPNGQPAALENARLAITDESDIIDGEVVDDEDEVG